MTKSKKYKPKPPRVKRMKRTARLESARKWIPTYTGKRLLRGYCNHYGVNWQCAAIELKMLGFTIDPTDIATRKRAETELVKRRQARKKEIKRLQNEHWHPFTDQQSAYLAGDFAALHDLQMREEYGDEWEHHEMNEYTCRDGAVDDEYQPDGESSRKVEEPTMIEPGTDDDWIPF